MGKELQPLSVDGNFALLGFSSVMDDNRKCHVVLDDCIMASEIYEYGFILNNSVYRLSSLLSMKLLHCMRLIDYNRVNEGHEYINEMKDYMKQYRVNNPSISNQIDLLLHQLTGSELK